MSDTEISSKTLLEEIRKSNQSIKNLIEASETRLLLKLEEHSLRLTGIEEDLSTLQDNIEHLDQNQRKNNIFIFGLDIEEAENHIEVVLDRLNQLLNLKLAVSNINNLYCVKNIQNKPIKIEFLSYLQKLDLLKQCYKLKGTKISIVHDLTYKERQDNVILKRHYKLAKDAGENNCKLRRGELIVDGKRYTAADLRNSEEAENINTGKKAASAPNTPNKQPTETFEQDKSKPGPLLNKIIAATKARANSPDPNLRDRKIADKKKEDRKKEERKKEERQKETSTNSYPLRSQKEHS